MIGRRKLIATLAGMALLTAVAVVGLLRGVEPVGLAALVTSLSAPLAWFVVGSIGEWNARRHDQSSIADQTTAERGAS